MAITQAMCTSFKVDLLNGIHAFGTTVARAGTTADTMYMALYTSAATLDDTTTAYSATNEVSGTGYVAGGQALSVSQVPTSSSTTAFLSFSDETWTSSTITARGALIYNSTQSNKSVAVLDFGSDKTSTAGDFTVVFPTADASNAIIRIA
jgi:hypothetical protein